jgi:hypothetical protein
MQKSVPSTKFFVAKPLAEKAKEGGVSNCLQTYPKFIFGDQLLETL